MNYIIPTITCVFVAIVFYLIGKSTTKIIKPTSEEILELSIKNVEFLNTLSPITQLIYKHFMNKENLKYFQEIHCEVKITDLNISIWSANELYGIRFTFIPTEILKEHNLTIKEVEKTLTLADRKVLYHIVEAVKVNNKEFISRLFL
jgi:hypothetical protein